METKQSGIYCCLVRFEVSDSRTKAPTFVQYRIEEHEYLCETVQHNIKRCYCTQGYMFWLKLAIFRPYEERLGKT
jgi:hypothetical protein